MEAYRTARKAFIAALLGQGVRLRPSRVPDLGSHYVSTNVAMMALVTVDMLSETTLHIAGRTAVAVGPGHRWAVDVSSRKMNRPPTPRWSRS